MITRVFTLLLLLVSFATGALGQTPPDVHVKLSLAENKTVYRIGEPIKIVLEFTADRDGYNVETTPEGNDLSSDKILISPETGITHWYAELMDNRRYGRDYAGYAKLTSSPEQVEIILNDTVRFNNPARYTVSVTTSRVHKRSGEAFIISTNAISFEVQAMDDEDEAKEVKRLTDVLNVTRESRAGEPLARRLSYLTGDPSTREKVRRFVNSDERTDSYRGAIYHGVFIARNRALALKLIENALRDPNIPVTTLILGAACRLKVLINYGVSGKPPELIPALVMEPREEDPRNREIREAYLAELAAGLSKRTGNSLTTTASTILTSMPKESQSGSAAFRDARNVLVQQFDSLHPYTQEWLLRVFWEQLRDPALIPSLKKMLATTGIGQQNMHETALLKLLEMTPDDVRPYVVAEIRNPDSFLDAETLGKLKDDSLPEVDASLLEQIRKLTHSTNDRDRVRLRPKTQLLVRFATESIYPELMQLYQELGANLPREARPGLLAYFAKHNEREAMPLIEQAVSDLKPGEYPQILSDLTMLYYSDAIGALLKKLLESDDPAMASHVAYLIGKHGSAGDEKLLEARLNHWREQWGNRIAEADAQLQGRVERELISAVVNGKSWKLSPERERELRASCLTQLCKQNNVMPQ